MGNLVVSFKGDKNGYGEILMLNGSKYKGQCNDGKRNGNGKMTYLNGNVYGSNARSIKITIKKQNYQEIALKFEIH